MKPKRSPQVLNDNYLFDISPLFHMCNFFQLPNKFQQILCTIFFNVYAYLFLHRMDFLSIWFPRSVITDFLNCGFNLNWWYFCPLGSQHQWLPIINQGYWLFVCQFVENRSLFFIWRQTCTSTTIMTMTDVKPLKWKNAPSRVNLGDG